MTDPTRDAFAVDEDTINLALDAWFDGDCSRPHYDEHIDQMRAAASVIVAALSARAHQGREAGEAVAWLCSTPDGVAVNVTASERARNDYARFGRTITPLYTTPAVRAVDLDDANWTKRKPSTPGVYGVRGYELCVPAEDQFEAVVLVRLDDDGELRCNIHESTTYRKIEDWSLVDDTSDNFEWCELAIAALTQPEAE